MRQVESLVRYQVPQGSEVTKDVRKAGLIYILIGEVRGERLEVRGQRSEGETAIQLNKQLVSVDEIPDVISQERAKMSEDERQQLTVCIRADRQTEMGVINDVKQALRRAGVLNINYAAAKKQEARSK